MTLRILLPALFALIGVGRAGAAGIHVEVKLVEIDVGLLERIRGERTRGLTGALSPSQIQSILDICTSVKCDPNHTIYAANSDSDQMHILLSGELRDCQ